MLITILSAEYLDISAKCRCWGRLSQLISSRRWYCSDLRKRRWSKLVTRKQFMCATHSLLQIISWGGPGLILLQLYRQLLPPNIITRLGFIMSTEQCNWYKNTSALRPDQLWSLGKSCNSSFYHRHDELSEQSVISTDISHSWQSLTFCWFGNLTVCQRWRRIKIW